MEDWVSRAAALQRRGRAGRVRAGTCYCCYTRERFEQGLRQYAVPEVARVPLEELVLQVRRTAGGWGGGAGGGVIISGFVGERVLQVGIEEKDGRRGM